MKKHLYLGLLLSLLTLLLMGCQKDTQSEEIDLAHATWDEILVAAKGQTVNFYGWGGADNINLWLDTEVAPKLKDDYDVTLNRVPMNIDEILSKLLTEKQLDVAGTIDVVWINGENFYTAKTNELLHGPFSDRLPHFNQYVDPDSPDIIYDFGHLVEGYAAPYGKAQFVLISDTRWTNTIPTNYEALLELAINNPGKITYPAPPDFIGSAFIRNIIYDIVGYEAFLTVEPEKESVKTLIQPALDYLVALKPYLWREGTTYPATIGQVDNMFADGELILTMNYNPNHVGVQIANGAFQETAFAGVFEQGTLGNTHFLAIPANGVNQAASYAFINMILSPEMQASKYNPDFWGDLPVLDESRLSAEDLERFRAIPKGVGVPELDELLTRRLPEMPVQLVPIIEALWREAILD